VVTIALQIGLCLVFGCGQQHGTTDAPSPPGNSAERVKADLPPLPDWAPENPSPEFLRAAKVLKPLPPEVLSGFGDADPATEAVLARFTRTFVPAYELFGTLSDEQIDSFVSQGAPKQVRMPVKSLTAAQRAALDRWFEAYREAVKGSPVGSDGYLVGLYKHGARDDLSNVDVGFHADGSRAVHLYFWVRRDDGSLHHFGEAFAVI
jgi:hypothetical protein